MIFRLEGASSQVLIFFFWDIFMCALTFICDVYNFFNTRTGESIYLKAVHRIELL
jgi:hypothetical protein